MRAFLAPSRALATRLDAQYAVPKDGVGASRLAEHKKNLLIVPRGAFGAPPAPFDAWSETDTCFCVPRCYGIEHFGPPAHEARAEGEPIDVPFVGELTAVQRGARDAFVARVVREPHCKAGIVSLPCGHGKTVLGVHLVSAVVRRKSMIVVHKTIIRDQWKASLERFCPGIRVGCPSGQDAWSVDDYDVVIVMVLTLSRHRPSDAALRAIGLTIVDECHHLAARVMSLAFRNVTSRYVLGLTATMERADGTTHLLHWMLGPEIFHVERQDGEGVRVSVALVPPLISEIKTRDGKPVTSVMINHLAVHEARNAFIARRIVLMRLAGRTIMVLSDRLAQLAILRGMIVARGIPEDEVGTYSGQTREAEREAQLRRPIVLCSYGMANEGLDKREADTCVMATPKGRVTQCIGRVQRPCDVKKPPLVLDIADDLSVFKQLRWTRSRLYSKERYKVQVLDAFGATREDEWFL